MKVIEIKGTSLKDAADLKKIPGIISENGSSDLLIVVSSLAGSEATLEKLSLSYLDEEDDIFTLFEEIRQFYETILKELFSDPAHPVFDEIANTFIEIDWMLEDGPHPDADFSHDQIVSVGHLVSSKILAFLLNEAGIKAKWIDPRGIIHTDNSYRKGIVNMAGTRQSVHKLAALLKEQVLVTGGAVGGTSENYTTTLGTDGADYSAALLAVCLEAGSLMILDKPGAAPPYGRSLELLLDAGISLSASSLPAGE